MFPFDEIIMWHENRVLSMGQIIWYLISFGTGPVSTVCGFPSRSYLTFEIGASQSVLKCIRWIGTEFPKLPWQRYIIWQIFVWCFRMGVSSIHDLLCGVYEIHILDTVCLKTQSIISSLDIDTGVLDNLVQWIWNPFQQNTYILFRDQVFQGKRASW